MSEKQRIVELQAALKIARTALSKIKGGARNPESIADEALYKLIPLDPKYPLQGLVGHVKEPTPDDDEDYYRPDASGYSRADEEWFFDMDGKP